MLLGCSPLTPAPSVLPVPCTWGVNSCTGPLCQGRYKCIKKGTLTSTKCICQKLCPVQRVPSPAQLQAGSACLSARLKCPLIPHDHSKARRRPSAGAAARKPWILFPLFSPPLTLLHCPQKFDLQPVLGSWRHPDHASQGQARWLQCCIWNLVNYSVELQLAVMPPRARDHNKYGAISYCLPPLSNKVLKDPGAQPNLYLLFLTDPASLGTVVCA